MNLSNMFPASGGLAAQIKKPVATAVAKPTDNKASGRMGDQMAETS